MIVLASVRPTDLGYGSFQRNRQCARKRGGCCGFTPLVRSSQMGAGIPKDGGQANCPPKKEKERKEKYVVREDPHGDAYGSRTRKFQRERLVTVPIRLMRHIHGEQQTVPAASSNTGIERK